MRKTSTALLTLALAGSSLAGLVGTATADPTTAGLDIVGLAGGGKQLVTFTTEDTAVQREGKVTGLVDDKRLVGIDFRPANATLYGVGDAGGIYTISTTTLAASKVSQLSVALEGESFGVDFNPAADRLRIISETGQNLRHNINLAAPVTLQDGRLVYGPSATTPGTGTTGGTNTGGVAAVDVTGAAYTNNDADGATATPTGTALFDIDTDRDQLALQNPPNAGGLVAVGPLGLNATDVAGFDIYSPLDPTTGKAIAGADEAYAVLETVEGDETVTRLYSVSLSTGAANPRTVVNGGVTDLAVVYTQ